MNTYCPHCSASNLSDAKFCESCGQAMPDLASAGPQEVSDKGLASTETGRSLQAEQLRQAVKKSAGALLAVSIIQLLFAIFIHFMLKKVVEEDPNLELDMTVIYSVYAIAGVFFRLFFWARKSPLPAAIVGLVIFVSLHLLDAVADPASLARGLPIKIIIIVVLSKAIQAGIQHRRIINS